jgi:formylglycine-generating enzyme
MLKMLKIIVNVHEFEMLHVSGGVFLMGSPDTDIYAYSSEKPAHLVKISDFLMAKFTVTQSLWETVMNNENPSFFKGDDLPVEQVSWDDITQEFLPKLREITKLPFRLPTEAEWEYAAKGGIYSAEDNYKYVGSDRLKDVAWYEENSDNQTKPVGLKQPNQLGIYDMSGNVKQWCKDLFDWSEYYKLCKKNGVVENPKGAELGNNRIWRGGCWSISSKHLFSTSYRGINKTDHRENNLGFRLALSTE